MADETVKVLEVIWTDADDFEFALMRKEDGDYSLSCNGQAHMPVPGKALGKLLKDLASRVNA